MLNAHSYPITALNFSDDGKMLATYAYGDSTLSIWLVSFVLTALTSYSVYILLKKKISFDVTCFGILISGLSYIQ